jgi:hypothetical protein
MEKFRPIKTEVRFAADSLLEGDGFELLVPPKRQAAPSSARSLLRACQGTRIRPGRGALAMKDAAAHKRASDRYPANRPGAMMVADAAAARRNQVALGIAYMVGSTAMF